MFLTFWFFESLNEYCYGIDQNMMSTFHALQESLRIVRLVLRRNLMVFCACFKYK